MSLLTTTIGSYPKPAYVPTIDWFRTESMQLPDPLEANANHSAEMASDLEAIYARAAEEVILEQVGLGIDIPTDGEVRRENYIHYHCRRLEGIDFKRWTERSMRAGRWQASVPTIVGTIEARQPGFLTHDWQVAQRVTDRPVKMTVPGPLTISDTLADEYYGDERRLGSDLARAINLELQSLSSAGCRWIQVDEPLFAVFPEKALAFGIENLERCFHGLQQPVVRSVHVCCGYPSQVDLEDYPKADPAAYHQLAGGLDQAMIDAVSIEDAHRHNDLALLERFQSSAVILGVVGIARTRVEPVEEITVRLLQALHHIEPDRLLVAPDCGLGMLARSTIRQKLTNMVRAAQQVGMARPA